MSAGERCADDSEPVLSKVEVPQVAAAQNTAAAERKKERGPMPQCFMTAECGTGAQRSRARVLAYGDSMTAGYHSRGKRFAPYGKFLAERLTPHIHAEVWVCGLGGYTAQELSQEADAKVIIDGQNRKGMGLRHILDKHDPFDLVLIMLGTNDVAEYTNSEYIFKNIKKLHAICHKARTRTAILSIPESEFLFEEPADTLCNERWQEVNLLLKGWASTEEAAGLVSLHVDTGNLVPWTEHGGLFERDGLHFTPAGSRQLGTLLAPLLLPHLTRDEPVVDFDEAEVVADFAKAEAAVQTTDT